MSAILVGLWLFGSPVSSDVGDCRHAARRAARTIEAIESQWPLRPSADPVTVYVQSLGQRMARAGGGSGRSTLRFYVLRNLEPSGFALGDGRFVVSDGLIGFVRNEGELAAVLAHEIAHDELGHFCRDARSDTQRSRIGSVVQHFNLDLEIAADAAAVERLVATGYDPRAMYAVLHCLAQQKATAAPALAERVRALNAPPKRSARASPAVNEEFERLRRQVLDDLGPGVSRCRE